MPEPVPVAVLLPRPAGTRPPERHRQAVAYGWTAQVAGVLIAVYTQPGDLVAVTAPELYPGIAPIAAWLDRKTALRPDAGPIVVRLVLGLLPRPGAAGLLGAADWCATQRARLRDGGYLVVAVDPLRGGTSTDTGFADLATSLIAAARTAGLRYQQHLIAVHSRLPEPAAEPASLGSPPTGFPGRAGPAGSGPVRHARVHTDLYVFAFGSGESAGPGTAHGEEARNA
jgi:hypothetical protein